MDKQIDFKALQELLKDILQGPVDISDMAEAEIESLTMLLEAIKEGRVQIVAKVS